MNTTPSGRAPVPADRARASGLTDKDFFAWNDAQAMARVEGTKYCVTTPNMDFVPRPHIGLIQVDLCADFRYGVYDPVQWPQPVTTGWEYLPWIRRRAHAPLEWWPVWWTPREDTDFVPLEGCDFKSLGLLAPAAVAPLRSLVQELKIFVDDHVQAHGTHASLAHHFLETRRALERLTHFPSTFRDVCVQLRQLQRSWLMTRAFLDHAVAMRTTAVDVNRNYMGGFSTDPDVVQKLYTSGIPVWFVRLADSLSATKNFIATEVTAREPSNQEVESRPWDPSFPRVYQGLSGPSHLDAVTRSVLSYIDLSHSPLLVRYDADAHRAKDPLPDDASSAQRQGQSGVQRTAKQKSKPGPVGSIHRSQLRGRDKFEEVAHQWMPTALPAWRQAMLSVDRSGAAKPAAEIWGYWVPEPALLVGGQKPDRVARYFTNWLRVREAWLYLLRVPDGGATKVPTQWWRDFLNGDGQRGAMPANPTAHAGSTREKRVASIKRVFGKLFDMETYQPDERAYLHWFSHHTRVLDERLCPRILWELFELGFRYELLALDRVLVPPREGLAGETSRLRLLARVFPRYDLERLLVIPDVAEGFAGEVIQGRVPTLEAFRRVLVRWPLCPTEISTSSALTTASDVEHLEYIERRMTAYYVQTFFAYSGRAPLVPHSFPAEGV